MCLHMLFRTKESGYKHMKMWIQTPESIHFRNLVIDEDRYFIHCVVVLNMLYLELQIQSVTLRCIFLPHFWLPHCFFSCSLQGTIMYKFKKIQQASIKMINIVVAESMFYKFDFFFVFGDVFEDGFRGTSNNHHNDGNNTTDVSIGLKWEECGTFYLPQK